MVSLVKRVLIGRPIASSDEGHHRLHKRIALPVFASDAISSTAYATDEILIVLLTQAGIGAAAWGKLVPLAIVVAVLLVIVVLSYRQTIYAYPSGGGSYVVSRENLGETPSLIAGASLLTDYILTVAVSVAGGVLAIQSAFGFSSGYRVPLCLGLITLMTVANLRGLKESGVLFAPPTYLYVIMLMLLIGVGCYRIFVQHVGPIPLSDLSPEAQELAAGTKTLGLLMLLRAFSSGAVALSGVEAVSNGVPAFRKPESKNAAMTIGIMGAILGTCFLGVSVLAAHLHPYRGDQDPTGIALMAEYIYGGKGFLFWVTQLATFAVLILAANTAYADFPRLSSIIARDGFLPRQLANRGDRLVFSNGIIFLAMLAGVLIIVFKGNISALDPAVRVRGVHRLHAQSGRDGGPPLAAARTALAGVRRGERTRLRRHRRGGDRGRGLQVHGRRVDPRRAHPRARRAVPAIARHYRAVQADVAVASGYHPSRRTHLVVVLVGSVHRGVIDAVQYARSLAPERLIALSVVTDPEEQAKLLAQWDANGMPIPLHTISSPYRELTQPVLDYLDELEAGSPDDVITVVIPEFVTPWKQQWLHNQSAFALKARLLYRPNTVVTSVPVIVGTHPQE